MRLFKNKNKPLDNSIQQMGMRLFMRPCARGWVRYDLLGSQSIWRLAQVVQRTNPATAPSSLMLIEEAFS